MSDEFWLCLWLGPTLLWGWYAVRYEASEELGLETRLLVWVFMPFLAPIYWGFLLLQWVFLPPKMRVK
jgi:hypothetical protein